MLTIIGNHFPILVIAAMSLFALAVGGMSIEDAVKARGKANRGE